VAVVIWMVDLEMVDLEMVEMVEVETAEVDTEFTLPLKSLDKIFYLIQN